MTRCIPLTAFFVLACAPVAFGGAIVELVPDQPGPYVGGESLGLDVWLHNDEDVAAYLRGIRFDFVDSSPQVTFDAEFVFDLSSLPSDDGWLGMSDFTMPVPSLWMSLDIGCPVDTCYLTLPESGSFHAGSVGVELPSDPGVYRIDALNADEPDYYPGAWMMAYRIPSCSPPGHEIWRAFTGEIQGGSYDFVVIPEPGTACLFAVAGLLALRRGHKRVPRPFR